MVIGFALLFFQGISELIKRIAVMRGLIPDPTPFMSPQELAAREAELAATGGAHDDGEVRR